jgi:endo-1,4-beta-xylanase
MRGSRPYLRQTREPVDADRKLKRRTFLLGTAGLGVSALASCTGSNRNTRASGGGATATAVLPSASSAALGECSSGGVRAPLWQVAAERGLVYGSSAATWQLSDRGYRRLFEHQSGILFTEDDLLWWRLRPTPDSALKFGHADKIIDFAERQGMLVLGAHLVWDEGFGEGWTDDDLWGMQPQTAKELLFSTIDRVVARYRGRVAGWIVVNEAVDTFGVRTDVPWYETIGPTYIAESFRRAHAADPNALLLYNDFGFETDDGGHLTTDKRAAVLEMLDGLLAEAVPVHALGVQAHLHADGFLQAFDAASYRTFLSEVSSRGLKILITEMDVLDDGLPAKSGPRDAAIADIYRTYLQTALSDTAVISLITFGLSDRYTWLQEDYPREDGARRRPLPFDESMRPKRAYAALDASLAQAAARSPFWLPPRC